MQAEQIIRGHGTFDRQITGQLDLVIFAAMLDSIFSSRDFDQDPAHRFGGSAEEMSAAIPVVGRLFSSGVLYESQIGFVDKGGRLQSLPWPFVSEPCLRQFTKLVIDNGQQSVSRLRITGFDLR